MNETKSTATSTLDDIAVESVACIICGGRRTDPEAVGCDYLYATSSQPFRFVRCLDCGHIYLNPRPTATEAARIYPPSYASFSRRFAKADSLIGRLKDKVLMRRFQKIGVTSPSMRVLDVGCGDGAFLISLRRQFPGAELTGLDWHFPGETRAFLQNAGITLVEERLETAPLPQNHFDIVIMNQLIEHLWQPASALEKCYRALRVGGLLAIETPNPDGYDRRWFFRDGAWGSYYYPRHLNLFTTCGLRRFIEERGFRVRHQFPLLAPPCWIYSMISLKARHGWRVPGYDRFFADTNPLALGLFAAVDTAARCLGLTTSNQKLIAEKLS